MFKYKVFIMLFMVALLYGVNHAYAKENRLKLFNKVIYIDAGHGGKDPGALYNGVYEKDINLAIASKLEKLLYEEGAIVYMTRYGDYDLSANINNNRKRSDLSRRSKLINESDCDMYVSIHLNAEVTGAWHGAQAFYDDINPKNEKIADIMQKEFKSKLNSKRKYKKISDVYLHRKTNRPGVLVEVGFLSNSNDRYLLKQNSYQMKIAETLKSGIEKYFNK